MRYVCRQSRSHAQCQMQASSVLIHSDGAVHMIHTPSDLDTTMRIIYAYMHLEVQANNFIQKIEVENDDSSKTWICFLPNKQNSINQMATAYLQMCGREQLCFSNVAIFDMQDGRVKCVPEKTMFEMLARVMRACIHENLKNACRVMLAVPNQSPPKEVCFEEEQEDDTIFLNERQSFDTWSDLLLD